MKLLPCVPSIKRNHIGYRVAKLRMGIAFASDFVATAAASLSFAEHCPGSSGPCCEFRKNFGCYLREHRIGEHVFVAAVTTRQSQCLRSQILPTLVSISRQDGR